MKVRKISGVLAVTALLLAGAYVLLRPAPNTQILVSDATAAPLVDQPNTIAVFLKIENTGPADRLISATSPDAKSGAFSDSSTALAIPGKGSASLAADGVFLRLYHVSGPLTDGRTLPVSLTFETAGTVQTRARLVAPRQSGKAGEYGLFGIGDICEVGDGEPAPEIALAAEQTETGWTITVQSYDFEFTPDLADGPHVPGTGHGHIYLNGLKLGRLYTASKNIGALPSGEHEIRVTLSTNDHRAYVADDTPVTASIRIHSD